MINTGTALMKPSGILYTGCISTLFKKETQNHIKKETQNHIQKKKRKTTFKKRNAKPHIGDIGKIILIAVW